MTTNNNDIKAIIDTVNKKIIADMEAGNTNWVKSWVDGDHQSIEGHYYSGFNNVWLSCLNFKRPLYGTYIQWNKKGCKVKKGSKAVKLIRVQTGSRTVEDKKTGNEDKVFFKTYRTFPVFNINQVEGNIEQFDGLDAPKENKVIDKKKIENFVLNTGAVIKHGEGKAYYRPSGDYIGMPDKNQFLDTSIKSATENYYAVLLHELTHWTGASHRLNRTKGLFFGDPQYAFEELIAELGSAYACKHLGLNAQPREDHAHYLKSWLRAIKDNKNALIRASGYASKSLNYLIEKQTNQGLKQVA
jgi:antirestriction protein ArdC